MDNTSLFFLIFGFNSNETILNSLMMFGAEYLVYLTLLGILMITFKGKVGERKALLLTLLALPIVVIIIKAIHLIFYEPRPFVSLNIEPLISHKADASFPSRHTSIMSAIAFAYLYCKSKWAPILILLTFWVGLSRIYVGVHYPLDILGAVIVGIVAVIIALQLKRLLKLRFFGQPLKS